MYLTKSDSEMYNNQPKIFGTPSYKFICIQSFYHFSGSSRKTQS
jgi:hypothetical protein